MYGFRLNLDTHMVEILLDGFVEYEIPKADFDKFAYQAWSAAKNPTLMDRVGNVPFDAIK